MSPRFQLLRRNRRRLASGVALLDPKADHIPTAGDPGSTRWRSPPEKRNPVATLSDDLLIKILRRLPVRSVCRFKCVSRSWRNLISDRANRKKLPHTLTGFFYRSLSGERFLISAHHFTNVTGKGIPFIFPSFSFLPHPSDEVVLLDSCNGLLLCRCFEPGPHEGDGVPPFHYAVCNPATEKWMMLPDGSWASGEARTACLGFDPAVSSHFHVVEYVVDEDYGTHEWTLKHSIRKLLLFRQRNLRFDLDYKVIAVHPECNLIYFVYGWDTTLMAYEMDRKEVRVIRSLGHDSSEPFLHYVPLFSEALADDQ
ncbi:unnamed protein product [Urochloa decumbens]|uniref:F-box domain-containing protein n=1 Tax=Urochloa decumbens TaxID=240449 RepID=A0ABC8WTT8_9POAL